MPISEKQLAANRANAKKSTGPRTEAGKARSAMNGFNSRITGLTTIMTSEDRIARNQFVDEYVDALAPEGVVELQLARTIALDNWRLNRIKTVEENIFAFGLVLPARVFVNDRVENENAIGHAHTYLLHSDKINRISLYESRLSRLIADNLDRLERLQARRADRARSRTPEAARQIHQNESFRTANGFASANLKSAPPTPQNAPPGRPMAA